MNPSSKSTMSTTYIPVTHWRNVAFPVWPENKQHRLNGVKIPSMKTQISNLKSAA